MTVDKTKAPLAGGADSVVDSIQWDKTRYEYLKKLASQMTEALEDNRPKLTLEDTRILLKLTAL